MLMFFNSSCFAENVLFNYLDHGRQEGLIGQFQQLRLQVLDQLLDPGLEALMGAAG